MHRSEEVNWAQFWMVMPAVPLLAVALIVSVAEAFLSTLPTVQIPLPLSYAPRLAVLET
jgi:hypothetical protein